MGKILVIDDEEAIYRTIEAPIQHMGAEVEWAPTLNQGLSAVEKYAYDIVLVDAKLPDGCGLEVMSRISKAPMQPEVIVMAQFGILEEAEIAIQKGAWDYVQKTESLREIKRSLKRALEYRNEKESHRPSPVPLKLSGIIGESQALQSCFTHLARAASSDANVLITGETGTGKEIFARAIHRNSSRSGKSLVVVDCAALPETLVESLLFGHEKGAYTGANQSRDGLIGQADDGTLFLDEIGEMPLAIQKVFLRVLQERKYRPVGGRKEIHSDFRLVAATNRNLDEMVREGTFRKDLLFRIRSIEITLPPLRERQEDIKLLSNHYLSKICQRYGIETKEFAADFIETMGSYCWPGNVRELINAIETAISNSVRESTLYARHLPKNIRLYVIGKTLDKPVSNVPVASAIQMFGHAIQTPLLTFKAFRKSAIHSLEKQYLEALIDTAPQDIYKAIDISGLSRSRLYDLLKQHCLSI